MDDCPVEHPDLGPCRRTKWHAYHVFGYGKGMMVMPNEAWEGLPKKLSPKKIKAIADSVLNEREN